MRRDRALLLAAVSVLAAAAGCGRKPAPPGAAPAAAPQVGVITPEMRAVRRVVDQPGSVQAFEETALHPKLSGYVGFLSDDPDKKDRPPYDRQIDIGSRVKKDQVLAELSIPELGKEWEQKKAMVKQAGAEVVQADKALLAAGAGVAAAREAAIEAEAGVARAQALYDRWQSEMNRMAGLVKGGVIDVQTRDETQNQFKAAEATRAEATARVASMRAGVRKAEADQGKAVADVEAAAARLEVARAEVGRLEALKSYTRIKAPFDGVVTHRGASTGDYVTGTEKTALFSVARVDPVRVVVKVPEADAGLVAPGQEVRITLQGSQGVETGKVTRTSWSLEPGSRTLRTEVDLPNAKGLLRPGMYVYARLTAELPAAWTVPAAAIGKVDDDAVIYLAQGGKAVRVAVEVHRGDGQFTQIRRYKRPGSAEWTDVNGTESVASPAASLTDGQAL